MQWFFRRIKQLSYAAVPCLLKKHATLPVNGARKLKVQPAIINHIMQKKDVEILAKNLQDWLAYKRSKQGHVLTVPK
jgi:hypothetical protein